MKRITRHSVVLGATAVLACIITGGVVAGQFAWFGDPERLGAAVQSESMIQVASIAASAGEPGRGVFAQVTSTGHFCLWDAPSAASPNRQGGCNSAEDPLGGRELSISFAYDGGPDARTVRDARLIGIASSRVGQVSVLMSDGTQRAIPLRRATVAAAEYRAFGYRFMRADLGRDVTPTAVIAFDSGGQEIERQATGFAE